MIEQPIDLTTTLSPAHIALAFSGKEYIQVIGRRKTSTCTVRVSKSDALSVVVNSLPYLKYFTVPAQQNTVQSPLVAVSCTDGLSFSVVVTGGGISGQAEAVRHGIARVLTVLDPDTRSVLKKLGFLKRDPRSKERKKPGLKKARKASQWSKR